MNEDTSDAQSKANYTFQQVIGPDGSAAAPLSLASMTRRFRIIFAFQDACPGCHLTGFPVLQELVTQLRGNKNVSFLAVQTAFEDFTQNTVEQLSVNQGKYALPIPFAHDDGNGDGSPFMKLYQTGGTPWWLVLDRDEVVASGFQINPQALVSYIEDAIQEEPIPPKTR